MKRGLALLIAVSLIIVCLSPMLPVRAAEETILVEAENYLAGTAANLAAAEDSFAYNEWDSGDWSGNRGMRFQDWGYCTYTASL